MSTTKPNPFSRLSRSEAIELLLSQYQDATVDLEKKHSMRKEFTDGAVVIPHTALGDRGQTIYSEQSFVTQFSESKHSAGLSVTPEGIFATLYPENEGEIVRHDRDLDPDGTEPPTFT